MKKCLNCGLENPDGAHYCARCRFTLDWESTVTDDPTLVVPPATAGFEMAIGPDEKRVATGGEVNLQVRLVNRGAAHGTVELRVAGPAAEWATVEPRSVAVGPGEPAAATLTLVVPPDARPGTVPVEVYATAPGGSGASVTAQATLVVEPSGAPGYRVARGGGVSGGRRAVVIAGSLAAVVAVVVAGYFLLGGDDDPSGTLGVVQARSGLCLHSELPIDSSTRIPPHSTDCEGLNNGTEVHVECAVGDALRLSDPEEGLYITSSPDLITLESTPESC